MSIMHSLAGSVVIEIVSADTAGVLDLICKNRIRLWDIIHLDQLTIRVRISRHAWRKLELLLSKHGDTCHIVAREGVYWDLHSLVLRPVVLFGIVVFLFMGFYLPGRVFFVRVEGNSLVCSNQILEAAAELGIRFGASRRYVRSEQVKNGLLSAIDNLTWVGVNTKGCIAIISVQEHGEQNTDASSQNPGDIVALRDGVVLSCDVIRGNGVCVPNQAVKSGQILISGTLDRGNFVTYTAAEGEVFAATQRQIVVLSHAKTLKRKSEQRKKTKFKLMIGKKLINFFKGSGISCGTCVKMYSKYVLTLPGGFELPLGILRETVIETDLSEVIPDEHWVRNLLSDFASAYTRDHMIAGRILDMEENFSLEGDVYCLSGNYACTEMIGRVQQDQIGAYYGKTD